MQRYHQLRLFDGMIYCRYMEDQQFIPRQNYWSLIRFGVLGFGIVALFLGVYFGVFNSSRTIAIPKTIVPREFAPAKGPLNAPILIIEYGDFECPYCKQALSAISQIAAQYPEAVRLEFRQFPLYSKHPNATLAGVASLCAHAQGKFWEYHDQLFAYQDNLTQAGLLRYAQTVGLNTDSFQACLVSKQTLPMVSEEFAAGIADGVKGTPTFFVNGEKIEGPVTYEQWRIIIERLLVSKK